MRAGSTRTEPARGFLALGDSYTIGEGVAEPGRWPVQLARALIGRGRDPGPVRIIATTGWTSDELDAGIDAAHAQAPVASDHALVSLLIGVNNQYRGYALESFEQQFSTLLQRAHGYAADADPGRVLVLAIPDWGVTPYAIRSGRDLTQVAAELDAFNQVCRARTRAAGSHWIDTAALYRLRGAEASMLADDGLHPSAAMYGLWAALALPAAYEALK